MVSRSDVEKLFLQAVLSRGILSGNLARLLLKKCIDAVKACDNSLNIPYPEGDAWDGFVAKVNRNLDKLDLEFRHIHDETTGQQIYALVNRKDDEVAQMATDYSVSEIMFFKAVVEQIMLAPRESFSITSLAALREVSAMKPKSNMSKTQAETVLGSFVAKGWLLKSKRGRYSLSTRALLELLPYLKSTYPDEIVECTICMEIITRGMACYTSNCKTRMHYHCFSTYRRRNNSCPACSKTWPKDPKEKPLLAVGEDAVRDGDDGKRRVRAINEEETSDEEEDFKEDEPDASQPSQSQAVSKTSRTTRAKVKTNENMDLDATEEVEYKPSQKHRRSSRR